jgi:benzoyl-CoA reductase/2-hydroxyglutaryl-CoA dehydratase subunit BcrC/BadD/HgdB
VIEEFKVRFERRHARCRKLKEDGSNLIACFYGLVPKELIHAAGMIPIQLIEERNPKFDEASKLLPYLCGMSKNLTGQIYDEIYDYVDGAMVATVCDTNRRVYDIWKYRKAFPHLWLVRTPTRENGLALEYLAKELRRLARELESLSGKKVTQEGLWESIQTFNENRNLFKQFYDLRPRSGVSAEDALYVFASALVTPVEEHNALMEKFISTLSEGSPSNNRTRLMLSAINFNMALDVIRMAEKYDAIIVTDDFINNSRFGIHPIERGGDPFLALARGYLRRIPAPGLYPFQDRASYIREAMQKADARGLIYLLQLYCDAFAMEYAVLKERFDAWKLPHLKLEAEDTPSSIEQLNVRIQSFVETLI